jgi:hypothetical protein
LPGRSLFDGTGSLYSFEFAPGWHREGYSGVEQMFLVRSFRSYGGSERAGMAESRLCFVIFWWRGTGATKLFEVCGAGGFFREEAGAGGGRVGKEFGGMVCGKSFARAGREARV